MSKLIVLISLVIVGCDSTPNSVNCVRINQGVKRCIFDGDTCYIYTTAGVRMGTISCNHKWERK